MLNDLMPREKEFLSLLAKGLTNEEIAQEMKITFSSAKNYLNQVYEKLGFEGGKKRKSVHRLRAALIYLDEMKQQK